MRACSTPGVHVLGDGMYCTLLASSHMLSEVARKVRTPPVHIQHKPSKILLYAGVRPDSTMTITRWSPSR